MHTGDHLEFWQRWAGRYTGFMKGSQPLYDAICRELQPSLNRHMQVLELACGTGQLSFPLSGRVKSWEATDFSPAMIHEAKRQPGSARLHFSVRDATALPYGDGTFDAVVIANALHIMPEPEKALAEIRRVLKPDGLLLAPNFLRPTSILGRLRMGIMSLAGFHSFHSWSLEEYTAFLRGQGFAVTDAALLGGGLLPLCCAKAKKA